MSNNTQNPKTFKRTITLSFYQNEINDFDNIISQLDNKELSTAFLDFLSTYLSSIVNKRNYLEDIAYKVMKAMLSAYQEDRTDLKKEIVQDLINSEWKNTIE